MLIFLSDDSDPMLLNSLSAMNLLHKKLELFLQSTQQHIEIIADIRDCPHPYDRQLFGLRVIKSEGGISLKIDHQNWLVLSGDPENLRIYRTRLTFLRRGKLFAIKDTLSKGS